MVNYPVILRTIGCKGNYLNYYPTLQSIKLNGASTIIMIYQLLLIHGGKKKIVDISEIHATPCMGEWTLNF